ncbi:MAG: ABC transporter permease [Pollutimonas bauzanensis]|uniref:NitT/TauT family transport system permease protein n=1 Tax=Pollutimonas bauzanensis TaxID=658167 RepID=A0A1M5Y5Y0_9BURK|nr:ABC transporter permease [Pollutimonas bauzanensis]SHI07491.1 NitT/TauT family transport system permease protein [Pollutimonas bauzanensis]
MHRLTSIVYPAITLFVVLALWHFSVKIFQMPDYILPTPLAVARTLYELFAEGLIWRHIGYTLAATLIGYAIGSALALLFGALLAESRTFEKFVYPLLVAVQATPKVALAPLILVWFGFGIASKVVLVVLICFFPLFVNTIVGIRRVDPDLIDACKAFSATRWYLFRYVKLPAAAGDIFAGLQIGIALALIGTVVGELVSSEAGLGYLIGAAAVNMNVSTMFAGVFLLALMGVIGAQFIRWMHGKVVFWETARSLETRTVS